MPTNYGVQMLVFWMVEESGKPTKDINKAAKKTLQDSSDWERQNIKVNVHEQKTTTTNKQTRKGRKLRNYLSPVLILVYAFVVSAFCYPHYIAAWIRIVKNELLRLTKVSALVIMPDKICYSCPPIQKQQRTCLLTSVPCLSLLALVF